MTGGPYITSRTNVRVQLLKRLAIPKYRKKEELWLVEGVFALREAARAGLSFQLLALNEDFQASDLERAALETSRFHSQVMKYVSTTETETQAIAALKPPRHTMARVSGGKEPLVVALDGLQDPGNTGTVARAAEALGATGLLSGPETAEWGNPKTLRASAGALFHLPFLAVDDLPVVLAEAKRQGFTVMAAHPQGGSPPEELPWAGPRVLVVGAEGRGLQAGVLEVADHLITIPHVGRVSSINVAMAASICIYQCLRSRQSD